MDVSVKISQIVPLSYNGEQVFTTPQLAVSYECTTKFLGECFRRHSQDFIEGVDYFHLVGEELRNFKAYLKTLQGGFKQQGGFQQHGYEQQGGFEQHGGLYLPGFVAVSVASLNLWSKFGADEG